MITQEDRENLVYGVDFGFHDQLSAKKGEYGEEIVDQHLHKLHYIIYKPRKRTELTGHPVDRILFNRKTLKLSFLEIKTYPRRKEYRDTGINNDKLEEYKEIRYSNNLYCRFIVAFVDHIEKKIFWSDLDKLLSDSHVENNITYFPIDKMNVLCKLTDEQCTELKRLSDGKNK